MLSLPLALAACASEPEQVSGDTEGGAYTLLGGTRTPSNGNSITRNPGARWWIPSEDEWYKAAYYNGASSTYFDSSTRSTRVTLRQNGPRHTFTVVSNSVTSRSGRPSTFALKMRSFSDGYSA